MRKLTIPFVLIPLLCSLPAMAARTTVVPVVHGTNVIYQAYTFQGMVNTVGIPSTLAVSGVLSLAPEDLIQSVVKQVPFRIKNVVLQKRTPQVNQCADVFPAVTVSQQGMANIRLWWPLMYEAPGTTWTLTIVYGTSVPFDDDGPGPNPSSYVHTEVWTWRVEATLPSMKDLLVLFHQLPFGTSETPLISDDALYNQLQSKLDEIISDVAAHKTVDAGILLGDFEMEVMDACIASPPASSNGFRTGIANSTENPACCKLLVDAEYVGVLLGILQ